MRYLFFAILCYLLGTAAIIYFLWFMEFRLDSAIPAMNLNDAVANLLLFLLFPLQHSVFARDFWKNWITRYIHPLMERPVYVGTSAVALAVMVALWQPFGPVLFSTPHRIPFDVVFFLSCAGILWTSKVIDQSSLFGLKHGIAAWKGTSLPKGGLTKRGPFGYIRHPLTSFLILAIWSHHILTASRLEWNLLLSAYSLIGVIFEERDLRKRFGEEYLAYSREVPALIPWLRLPAKTSR